MGIKVFQDFAQTIFQLVAIYKPKGYMEITVIQDLLLTIFSLVVVAIENKRL